MKLRRIKWGALIGVVVLIVAFYSAQVLTQREPEYATRGEVADLVLKAADDYGSGLTRNELLSGPEGEWQEDQAATRLEAVVMISRAFGDLPQLKGDSLRTGLFDLQFNDVPAWAETDVGKLQKAGLLEEVSDQRLGADERITLDQAAVIIKRVWALSGTNLKDDFYSAVNKGWLDDSEIPAGDGKYGALEELAYLNNNRVQTILDELVQEPHPPGSKEQKLADFYRSALDVTNRNAQGITPIAGYLKAYEEAQTVEQLVAADLRVEQETGYGQLLTFAVYPDPKNSSVNVLYYESLAPSMDKNLYISAEQEQAYIDYLTTIWVLAGKDQSQAKNNAVTFAGLEKELSAVSLDPEEYYNGDKTYNVYPLKKLDDLYLELDMGKVLATAGFGTPERILVQDKNLLEKSSLYFTPNQLDLLKLYAQTGLLINTSSTLTGDFKKAAEDLHAQIYGIEGIKTDKQRAVEATLIMMSNYLDQIYVERYFSRDAKDDVERMIGEFIQIYEEKINGLDWMSRATKEKAIKKLETMMVKVGYPDQWPQSLDQVEIRNYDAGGSYFSNVAAVRTALNKANREQLYKPVDRTAWNIRTYEVNAYYNPLNNEIVFPAGILQAPLYGLNAPAAENLGGIGVIIAHEISHAFDSNGAKYDEMGNMNNWWTAEDYTRFEKKCAEVIGFYNGAEIIPGVVSDGTLTLGENTADLGAVGCSLRVLAGEEVPDYQTFFKAFARTWAQTATREMTEYLSKNDVHSNGRLRVNRTVVNFTEFYEAFGITAEDGMYVAPEKRVGIW